MILPPKLRHKSLLALILAFLLAGCAQTTQITPTATAVAQLTATATATISPTATATISPTQTAVATTTIPSTETAVTSQQTTTPPPTATAEPTTVPSPTATPTFAPVAPPATDVTQPPYAASSCSDRFPCNDDIAGWEERLSVPAGFSATYFARVQDKPTSITFGPDGRLYVAVQEGTIYALNANGSSSVYASGFNTPTGIAFAPGTNHLYVSSRVTNENIGGESQISIANGRQILSGLPCCYAYLHAANGIAFGPDGYGYVGVGGRADHGEILDGSNRQDTLHPLEATILRFHPDGGEPEVYARGFRNPYDLAWDSNGNLFTTDNAPDYGPPEEFHRVEPGAEHGYPWYQCNGCFPAPAGVQIVPPLHQFIPHSAPTGITVYMEHQFPGYYDSIFVTLWSAFPGAQKVVRFAPGGVAASDFAMGFAAPIDVVVGPDGSLYVADWATGIIFKISYTG